MATIRFKHGAAMTVLVLALFSLLTATAELIRGVSGVRHRGALVALVLGAVGLVVSSWYLWTTLREAELPDKAYDQLDLEE